MNQDQLLAALIAERCKRSAGASKQRSCDSSEATRTSKQPAGVATAAKLRRRQYVQMLAAGKARSIEPRAPS